MPNIRLSKIMADRGLCSRREADQLIEKGLVEVNGKVVSTLGVRIDPSERITIAPEALIARKKLRTVLLNKPPGYVSSQPEKGYISARTLIIPENQFQKSKFNPKIPNLATLHAAGRLDIDSSGLLVLTQDGAVARRLVHDNHAVPKEYVVRIRGSITTSTLNQLREGLELDGIKLRKVDVLQKTPDQLNFVLTQGRKRQIRRMCELVDLTVKSLVRIRIGNVHLGTLPRGKWRWLHTKETF